MANEETERKASANPYAAWLPRKQQLTRRDFLRVLAVTAATLGLGACNTPDPSPTTVSTRTPGATGTASPVPVDTAAATATATKAALMTEASIFSDLHRVTSPTAIDGITFGLANPGRRIADAGTGAYEVKIDEFVDAKGEKFLGSGISRDFLTKLFNLVPVEEEGKTVMKGEWNGKTITEAGPYTYKDNDGKIFLAILPGSHGFSVVYQKDGNNELYFGATTGRSNGQEYVLATEEQLAFQDPEEIATRMSWPIDPETVKSIGLEQLKDGSYSGRLVVENIDDHKVYPKFISQILEADYPPDILEVLKDAGIVFPKTTRSEAQYTAIRWSMALMDVPLTQFKDEEGNGHINIPDNLADRIGLQIFGEMFARNYPQIEDPQIATEPLDVFNEAYALLSEDAWSLGRPENMSKYLDQMFFVNEAKTILDQQYVPLVLTNREGTTAADFIKSDFRKIELHYMTKAEVEKAAQILKDLGIPFLHTPNTTIRYYETDLPPDDFGGIVLEKDGILKLFFYNHGHAVQQDNQLVDDEPPVLEFLTSRPDVIRPQLYNSLKITRPLLFNGIKGTFLLTQMALYLMCIPKDGAPRGLSSSYIFPNMPADFYQRGVFPNQDGSARTPDQIAYLVFQKPEIPASTP
ncbi:MAG: twin-arginine translocation signal domain-containing protein [Patescibacteria group bacterium]